MPYQLYYQNKKITINHEYRGVIVPIVTPFTLDEKVDVKSLKNLVNYLIDGGVHGIWAAGTSGEFSALTDLERLKVMETVAEEVNGRIPIIGNISATSTKLAIELAKGCTSIGIDGLAVTPLIIMTLVKVNLQTILYK